MEDSRLVVQPAVMFLITAGFNSAALLYIGNITAINQTVHKTDCDESFQTDCDVAVCSSGN